MALSGKVSTDSYKGRSVVLEWSATQSISANKSTISWKLVGAGDGGWVTVSELKVVADGKQIYYRDHTHHTDCYVGTVLADGSFDVPHNSDGSKSITFSVSAGIYNWAINCSGSDTYTLNTIPRASSCSVSGAFTMGSAGTIKISRASSSFKHTITYQFGNQSGTIATKTSSTSVSWTPSMNLAKEVPSATKGVGRIYLYTYSGNSKIGEKSITFEAIVPSSIKPSISGFTASRVNNSVPSGWGIYLQNKSQCKLTISAAGSYGSTIRSYSITQGGSTISSSSTGTSGVLTSSGRITFSAKVVDTRGRSASTTVSIDVVPYTSPTIQNVSSFRCLSNGSANDDGTYIKCNAKMSIASCGGHNTATCKLWYRPSGGSWSSEISVGQTVSKVIAGNADTNHSYEVWYEVNDAFQKVYLIDVVSTAFSTMDFKKGGKGVSIGKVAEFDNLFDVGMPAKFHKGLVLVDSSGREYDVLAILKKLS